MLNQEGSDGTYLITPESEVENKAAIAEASLSIQEELVRGKTFFGAEGISGAELARTGRSICGICHIPIMQSAVRFSYYYHPKRPSRWMHGTCFPQYLATLTALQQERVMSQLQGLQHQSSSSSEGALNEAIAHLLGSFFDS